MKGHSGVCSRELPHELPSTNHAAGPFLDDGTQRVDWEKIESIMLVLHYNLKFVAIREGGVFPLPMWDKPFLGCTPYSYVEQQELCPTFQAPAAGSNGSFGMVSIPSWSTIDEQDDVRILKQPSTTMEMADPYAIGGTWLRVVCFLDFSDLFNFNFFENSELRVSCAFESCPILSDKGLVYTRRATRYGAS